MQLAFCTTWIRAFRVKAFVQQQTPRFCLRRHGPTGAPRPIHECYGQLAHVIGYGTVSYPRIMTRKEPELSRIGWDHRAWQRQNYAM